ncbi:MAG TPA: hypothetical protein VG013_10655 [Gemmataceae bacterium]|jgi:hypothetical protein|nr:hypothetical protein [Gemmataceae bacterium]
MHRECTHCHRPFTPQDLAREESKGMEAERKTLGLQGVLFRYYSCPQCRSADIFVDVRALEGESPEAFHRRRDDLEAAVKQLHADQVAVVVTEKPPGCT